MRSDSSIETKIRNELIMYAKMKKGCDYETLHYLAGTDLKDNDTIDIYLRNISIQDIEESKPLIWAMVLENSKLPSDNFFKFVESNGIVGKGGDRITEHQRLLSEVFNYWIKRKKTGKRNYGR